MFCDFRLINLQAPNKDDENDRQQPMTPADGQRRRDSMEQLLFMDSPEAASKEFGQQACVVPALAFSLLM